MDVKEEDILGNYVKKHWYYVSKLKALLSLLSDTKATKLVDVGAGSGFFSKALIDSGLCEEAICVDLAYSQDTNIEWYKGKKICFTRTIANGNWDLVMMIDILEHVDNDSELLRGYITNLKESGRVLISVPAFNWLWSGHDIFLEHKRRYTLQQLEELVQDCGLRIIKCRYFFGLLFPVVVLLRLLKKYLVNKKRLTPKSDLKKYNYITNQLLVFINLIEVKTVFRVNRLTGLSILCLAEKHKLS